MLAESLNNGLVTGGFWEAETQALISAHPPPFVSESCHMIRETAQRQQIGINKNCSNNNNNTSSWMGSTGLAGVSLKNVFHITVMCKPFCCASVCSQKQHDALNIQIFRKANLVACLLQSREKRFAPERQFARVHNTSSSWSTECTGWGWVDRHGLYPPPQCLPAYIMVAWAPPSESFIRHGYNHTHTHTSHHWCG